MVYKIKNYYVSFFATYRNHNSARVEGSDEKHTLHDFRAEPAKLPVIRLSLESLVYRMENCRTYVIRRHVADEFMKEGWALNVKLSVTYGIL